MIYQINGEQPFQVLSSDFSISPSESGYELYFSADGFNYSSFATVGADVTRQFTRMNAGNYYKLVGNTGEVSVNWERDCGGGGGGTGSEVSYSQTLSAGTEIGQITIDGSATTIYAPQGDSGSDYSTEFNKVETVEHTDFVKYVFTHSGNTWDGNESPIATITNGDNSAQLSFYDGMTGVDSVYVNFSGYPAFHIANEAPFRLNMRLQPYNAYKNFPDFYFQYQTENGYDNTYNIIVPSGYTVTPASELGTGYAYEGSQSFSFNEIVPVSPTMLQPDFTGETAYAVMKYIITHRFDKYLPVCTNKHFLNGGNGEAGQEFAYLVEPSASSEAFNAYFIADGRNKIVNFNGNSYNISDSEFGKNIRLISFNNSLSLDDSTDVLYQNGQAMSTGSTYPYVIDFGVIQSILSGGFYGNDWFVGYYGLQLISGGTQTGILCYPSISRTQLPATVTIDGNEYDYDFTFDYGSVILRAYCNGNNMCANFRVEHRL